LVSDMWSGKENMAEEATRGLQVQRLYSALTFSVIQRYMPHPPTPSASGPCPLDTHRFADTHYETYAKRCAELGISPHPRTQKKKKVPDEGKEYARLVVYLERLLTDMLSFLVSQLKAQYSGQGRCFSTTS
jgi:hypothetical protein